MLPPTRCSLARFLPFALALTLAACGQSSDAKPVAEPATKAAERSPKGADAPASGAAAPAESRGFVVTDIKPAPDALFASIQGEVRKARAQGLKPYVEFWATWCEPCMAIKHSLDDSRMMTAFKGTYIIQINADDWHDHLAGTGFNANAIPVFFEVGDDGKPTGRKIDGGAWEDNIPANMAPPLDKFFHG